jgi:hypothetical protein
MEQTEISMDSDKTWLKLADMMVETGLIADWIEMQKKQTSGQKGR